MTWMGATQLSLLCPRGHFFSVWSSVRRSEWMVIHWLYVVTDPLIYSTLVVSLVSFRVPCHAITFDWSINAAPLPLSNLLTCHSLVTASIKWYQLKLLPFIYIWLLYTSLVISMPSRLDISFLLTCLNLINDSKYEESPRSSMM